MQGFSAGAFGVVLLLLPVELLLAFLVAALLFLMLLSALFVLRSRSSRSASVSVVGGAVTMGAGWRLLLLLLSGHAQGSSYLCIRLALYLRVCRRRLGLF